MKRLTLYWLNFSDELNASSFDRYDFYLVFNASTVLFFYRESLLNAPSPLLLLRDSLLNASLPLIFKVTLPNSGNELTKSSNRGTMERNTI
jgi:hypothetical protein